MKIKHAGFTLTELIIVVATVSIISFFSVPNFTEMVIDRKIAASADVFISATNYVQVESLSRSFPISLCASKDGTDCIGNWSEGWLAFVDKDNDGIVDSDEDRLRTWDPLPSRYAMDSNEFSSPNVMTFVRSVASSSGVFAFCYDSSIQGASTVIIGKYSIQLGKDSDEDGVPEMGDLTSQEITSCKP